MLSLNGIQLGNQDNIVYMEYNSTFAAVLTDGAQSAAHSGEGGLAISLEIVHFLIDNFSELWTCDEEHAKKCVWLKLDKLIS